MTRRLRLARRPFRGFTLVEMLIAMAITLIMIGAVVVLFANVSNSVRNRRAVVEISGQLRHARNMLQQDLQGATCPGLTWQRPEDNVGYIEIIEGTYSDRNPTPLLRDLDGDGRIETTEPGEVQLDMTTSILPRNNAATESDDLNNNSRFETNELDQYNRDPRSLSPGGIGDFDDILMLTVRNEHEPFVGRVPGKVRRNATTAAPFDIVTNPNPNNDFWTTETIESPLAEVVWYAVENPGDDQIGETNFGEPGLRTIYRRALLIAPWLNPYRYVASNGSYVDTFTFEGDQFHAKPGLLRILGRNVIQDDDTGALAALIAFQERYDISARVEWDPLIGSNGRWKIVANTLGDLTKRENRYEHHFYDPMTGQRDFPYAVASIGSGYEGGTVTVAIDRDVSGAGSFTAGEANLVDFNGLPDTVRDYTIEPANITAANRRLPVRPLAYVSHNSDTLATARVMLNEDGKVVRIVHGLVPLARERRGEDVMLTDALAFDLRVYDPGAPLFQHVPTDTVIDPTDPAWLGWPGTPGFIGAYMHNDNMGGSDGVGTVADAGATFRFVGQGSYVDLGYGYDTRAESYSPPRNPAQLPVPRFAPAFSTAIDPWFFTARSLGNVYGNTLAPGYAVYDTWSFHYENNGVNEDGDFDANGNELIDEGTNGLDDRDPTIGGAVDRVDHNLDVVINGPDDVGERETRPPYDRPLRGVQAVIRLFERDSRQIRQVTVGQSFVPE